MRSYPLMLLRSRTGLSMFLSVALIGCADSPAGPGAVKPPLRPSLTTASARSTEFSGLISFCVNAEIVKFKESPDGTVHFRGVGNRNQWVTGNRLIDGFETNDVRATIDKNGNGVAHIDGFLKPDAVKGKWEMKYTVSITGGVPAIAHGVGHGTRDLKGMTIEFASGPAMAVDNVCNPEMGGARVHGVIR